MTFSNAKLPQLTQQQTSGQCCLNQNRTSDQTNRHNILNISAATADLCSVTAYQLQHQKRLFVSIMQQSNNDSLKLNDSHCSLIQTRKSLYTEAADMVFSPEFSVARLAADEKN